MFHSPHTTVRFSRQSMGDQRNSRDQPAAEDGDGEEVHGVEAPARRHSPWTKVEHLLFLLGLEDHGRGAWRAIAMDYCVSRTPTQVASHAQKYFLRQELTPSRRHKKRPSIHDITRASINPYATPSERDHMRVTLQEIVRAGRDTAGASDSNDNSASSSGKSVSSTCLPVSDPIFGQVFAFTIDSAAAATTSSGGSVDVTFGVAGAQQMQQVQQMQYAIMHPMHGSGATSTTAPGAVGSWTLPGGAMLAPMQMPAGMHLQPAPHPGPMQMVQPQARLAYMTPAPGAPWPQHGPQHGPVQTLQPFYPSRPKIPLPHARNILPGATRPTCPTGPVARFAARRAAAQRGPAAPPHSTPVNPAASADAAYSHSMPGAGWITVPAQGPHVSAPHGNPSPPQSLPSGPGGLPTHQTPGETALRRAAHSQVMLSAPASAQGIPHPAPQQWYMARHQRQMARQQSTDSAAASSEKGGTPRDQRGTKREGETVQHLMHGEQPWQYLAQWQPGAQLQASFQASGTPSAGPHHRPGLQMPLWPDAAAGDGSSGPPLATPQCRAAVTVGDSYTVSALQVSSSRALVSTLSEPLNAVGSGSGTGLGSSYHVACRSTVPESQPGPGAGGEASSQNHALLPPAQATFAQRPVGDKMKWPSTHGMHGMPLPMQSPSGDLMPLQQPESSRQLPPYSAQPPHYPAALLASLPRSASACGAQLPQIPFSAPAPQLPPPPVSAPAPHGSGASVSRGAQTPPRGPPGTRSPGIADSCSGRSMHASSFQPLAHDAGAWSAHAGDALDVGSLQETGDGIVDYLLGNMPLLADPLLDADVFEKSSSGNTDAGSGSAGARSGVAGGGA
eukprot:jgi/Ulvmu1/10807/UM069_0043.1